MDSEFAAALLGALVGALVGGVATLAVAIAVSRREQRARYGEAMLEALISTRIQLHDAEAFLYRNGRDGTALEEPVELGEQARRVWVTAALASSLEWRPSRRRAMQGWSLHMHESMLGGIYSAEDIERLSRQVATSEYLVVSWIARRASGRDFRRPFDEMSRRFGPRYTERDIPAEKST